ncbi:phasin family protein [Dechloromonas sp. H13]|uniref:phasin family protein n=1 Tax=Dechloromonas sp. H13 TaxID=2570193 RepID=UPI001290ECE4|nr:phasin family protein [Dechloromonas sp. H13]
MVKKFKALSENQLAQTVRESAHQIWLAGLGAYSKAQEEGNKVFDALVKEGETIQKKTRKAADEKMAVVAGKAAGTWDRLEQVFEDRVARALSSLGVPTKKDIDKLSKRVAELTAVVQQLTEAQEGTAKKVATKAAAVPATVKAVAAKAAPAKKPAAAKSVAVKKAAEPADAAAGAAAAA